MFYGKAITRTSLMGTVYYFTRKDRRHVSWFRHTCNPGKRNKQTYNRQLRNGRYRNYDFKMNEWKKVRCADKWNWC